MADRCTPIAVDWGFAGSIAAGITKERDAVKAQALLHDLRQ
jgi:hypothetical protein